MKKAFEDYKEMIIKNHRLNGLKFIGKDGF